MPNRILREGILTSPRIAKLGWAEEVFYRRLMSVVDDFGRYYADAGMLRAACYPRQLSKVSDSDIEKWIACAQKAALVRVYEAEDSERYIELLDFKQQVRAKDSKFPNPRSECIADATQTNSTQIANAHLDVSVDVGVNEGVVEGDKPASRVVSLPKKPKDSLMPDDFCISAAVRCWAQEKGHTRLEERLEHFRGYAKANGKRYADWDQAFMNAIRGNWAKLDSAAPHQSMKVAL